jgi:DUF4097 and DUF4098 domain-containing protein YvlB
MRITRPPETFALALLAVALHLNTVSAKQEFQEEFHKSYPLDKLGQVSLENVNGNVHVLTWDREEVKIDAVKHANKQEHLAEVKIEVNATPKHVEIKTKYPDSKSRKSKNNSTSVDYSLTVPKQSHLHKVSTVNGAVDIENVEGDVAASSVNGSATATGLRGEAHLSSVNGPVSATFVQINKGVVLESVNGSVKVAVPPQANAEVSASTVNGGIGSDFSLPAKKHFPVGQNLRAKLGEGGPLIKISTVNGGIRIDHDKALTLENP